MCIVVYYVDAVELHTKTDLSQSRRFLYVSLQTLIYLCIFSLQERQGDEERGDRE